MSSIIKSLHFECICILTLWSKRTFWPKTTSKTFLVCACFYDLHVYELYRRRMKMLSSQMSDTSIPTSQLLSLLLLSAQKNRKRRKYAIGQWPIWIHKEIRDCCRKLWRSMKSTFVVSQVVEVDEKYLCRHFDQNFIRFNAEMNYYCQIVCYVLLNVKFTCRLLKWYLNRLEIIHDHLRVNMEYYCGQTVRTFVWFYSELTATSFRRNFIDQRST